MARLLQRILRAVRQLTNRYLCTILAVAMCCALLFLVPQIGYAYKPFKLTSGFTMSAALVLLFFAYFAISAAGVLAGEHFYQRRWQRQSPWEGDENDRMKYGYAAFVSPVTWPNILAKSMKKRRRRLFASVLLAVSGALSLGLGADTLSLPRYPLSELLWINVAWSLGLLGVWMLSCDPDGWSPHGAAPSTGQVIGWRIGWLVTTCLLGEIVWFVATLQMSPSTGYLMYTQWAVLQCLLFLILTAHTLDYLERRWDLPVRVAGLTAVVVLLVLNLRPAHIEAPQVEASKLTTTTAQPSRPRDEYAWIDRLERRVDAVPVGPCIIVMASGGGTRAALFTSLVLRAMELERSGVMDASGNPKYRFADHVVIISSVSGGSLAAAHCMHRRGAKRKSSASPGVPKNSHHAELIRSVKKGLQEELSSLKAKEEAVKAGNERLHEAWELRVSQVRKRLEQFDQAGTRSDAWVFHDPVVDDMSTDFMAPILRGALTPVVSRGDALRRFWSQIFQWGDVTNVSGFPGSRQDGTYVPAPLVLFNACNTTWGTRYTISYPPLPQPFFRPQNGEAAQVPTTRFPIRSLSDAPVRKLSLSHAVRLSSNFPWGFRVRKFEDTNLLDGGIVDNTGFDTVFEVFRRLKQTDRGRLVMAKMACKGVFLLEIDSGGKPSGKRSLTAQTAGLMEPLKSMGNALHTNADVVKEYYAEKINEMIHNALKRELEDSDLEDQIPQMVATVKFQCEDFAISPGGVDGRARQEENSSDQHRRVMTAWALDEEQKGRVIARFLVELSVFRSQIESHRADLIKDLNDLAPMAEYISTRQIERASEDLADVAAGIADDPAAPTEELLSKVADLEQAIASAAIQQQTPASDMQMTKGEWIDRQLSNNAAPFAQRVQARRKPTTAELEELSEETREAVLRLRSEQRAIKEKMKSRLEVNMKARTEQNAGKSRFQGLQRTFDAKNVLNEVILD